MARRNKINRYRAVGYIVLISLFLAGVLVGRITKAATLKDLDVIETVAVEVETETQPMIVITDEVVATESDAAVEEYSEEDYEVLLQILTGECQSYSWEHQIAVGSVFLNRVASSYYPNTFYEVAHQKGQYACFKDGNAYRTPTQTSIEVADYLMRNGSQLPSNCVYQAQFKQGKGVYAKYGNTYICYR